MTNHIRSAVRLCYFQLYCLGKLCQYLNSEKLRMQLLCYLSCQGWTTATVVCGTCQRTSYWGYSESRTLLQELSLKQRGQITSLPFSVNYTGYLLRSVLTTKSSLLYTAAWMAQTPQYLWELIPRYLPVHHLQSSTQSGLCILNVEEGNKNKNSLESEHVSMLHPKLWNSLLITLREHNTKETFKNNLETYLFSEN